MHVVDVRLAQPARPVPGVPGARLPPRPLRPPLVGVQRLPGGDPRQPGREPPRDVRHGGGGGGGGGVETGEAALQELHRVYGVQARPHKPVKGVDSGSEGVVWSSKGGGFGLRRGSLVK
eukprot:1195168-Prorocentrum_minimum.AAC.6